MDANNNKSEQEVAFTPSGASADPAQSPDRRDVLERFGKFAVYAAPFTILALAKKADAASSSGPGKHSSFAPRR